MVTLEVRFKNSKTENQTICLSLPLLPSLLLASSPPSLPSSSPISVLGMKPQGFTRMTLELCHWAGYIPALVPFVQGFTCSPG